MSGQMTIDDAIAMELENMRDAIVYQTKKDESYKPVGPNKTKYMIDIGNKMREIRKSRGLSLRESRELTGVKESLMGSYERAERMVSVWQLHNIAQGYQVPITHFFGEATPKVRVQVDGRTVYP